MPSAFVPRLSQAAAVLPLMRTEMIAASARRTLPASVWFDLLPIVEDGLFGYELLPNRPSHTYLTIGCNERGAPVLRKSLYCENAPSTLRLAAVDGRFLSQGERDAWHRIRQRDGNFDDWTLAAEAIWDEIVALFPAAPRRAIEIDDAPQQRLDRCLAFARSCLGRADPRIEFCGVPDEAQYGFALTGRDGCGRLAAHAQGRWLLQWESAAGQVREHWFDAAQDAGPARAWARAATYADEPGIPGALLMPPGAGDTPRRTR